MHDVKKRKPFHYELLKTKMPIYRKREAFPLVTHGHTDLRKNAINIYS